MSGIRLIVDSDSATAPFRQLIDQVVAGVRAGTLAPGTRMPAVRVLAQETGVAANTAAKAYRELEAAGILESRGRSGTFVAAPEAGGAALTRAAEEYVELARRAGASEDEACAAVRREFQR